MIVQCIERTIPSLDVKAITMTTCTDNGIRNYHLLSEGECVEGATLRNKSLNTLGFTVYYCIYVKNFELSVSLTKLLNYAFSHFNPATIIIVLYY